MLKLAFFLGSKFCVLGGTSEETCESNVLTQIVLIAKKPGKAEPSGCKDLC